MISLVFKPLINNKPFPTYDKSAADDFQNLFEQFLPLSQWFQKSAADVSNGLQVGKGKTLYLLKSALKNNKT